MWNIQCVPMACLTEFLTLVVQLYIRVVRVAWAYGNTYWFTGRVSVLSDNEIYPFAVLSPTVFKFAVKHCIKFS